MPYATVDDLNKRFGDQEVSELLDRDFDSNEDTGVADEILGDASAEIDSILAARYPTPLSGSAPVLVVYCCDIARYRLYDNSTPEVVQARYDQTIRALERIAAGKADLLDGDGKPIADSAAVASAGDVTYSKPRERIFTDSTLSGFMGDG